MLEPQALVIPGYTALAEAAAAAEEATRTHTFDSYHETRAKNTLLRQQYDLRVFSKYLASIQIMRSAENLYNDAEAWRGMNSALLEAFKIWMLSRGYAIGTCNLRLATIRKYCELAYASGSLSLEEVAMIRMVKPYKYSAGINIDKNRARKGLQTRIGTKKAAPTQITVGQALQLKHQTTSCMSHRAFDRNIAARDTLLMCLLIEHALRVGEIVALNREHIDLEASTITVYREKTYTQNCYELMPRTREAAEIYLPLAAPGGPLFTSYRGKRMTRYGIYQRVRVLGELVGIEKLSPHDLRHFWTVDAFKNGNTLDLIQAYGGWNSPAMPLHYAKVIGLPAVGLKLSEAGK